MQFVFGGYPILIANRAFASTLMLSLAALSPQLRGFIPDLETLQNLTLNQLRPWAAKGSGIESAYDIVDTIRKKFLYSDGL